MMGKKKKRKYIPRKQFKFWLLHESAPDAWLMEVISMWKEKRQFTEMVKNGLRLMFSLGQGHLDVLFELFPQLETQLAAKYAPPPDTKKLEQEISLLRKLILEQNRLPSPPMNYPQSKQSGQGIGLTAGEGSTLVQGRKMELPTFDDDDMPQMTIKLAPLSSKSNSENLMAGIFGLGD